MEPTRQSFVDATLGLQTTDNARIAEVTHFFAELIQNHPIMLATFAAETILDDAMTPFSVMQSAIQLGRVFTPRPLFPVQSVVKMWRSPSCGASTRQLIKTGLFRGLMYQHEVIRGSSARAILVVLRADSEGGKSEWPEFYTQIMKLVAGECGEWAKLGAIGALSLVFRFRGNVNILPDPSKLVALVETVMLACTDMMVNDTRVAFRCGAVELVEACLPVTRKFVDEQGSDRLMRLFLEQTEHTDKSYARDVYRLIVSYSINFYSVIGRYMESILAVVVGQLRTGDSERRKRVLGFVKAMAKVEARANTAPIGITAGLAKALTAGLLELVKTVSSEDGEEDEDGETVHEMALKCLETFARHGSSAEVFSECAKFCQANVGHVEWTFRYAAIKCNSSFISVEENREMQVDYFRALIGRVVALIADPRVEVAEASAHLLGDIVLYATPDADVHAIAGSVIDLKDALLVKSPVMARCAARLVQKVALRLGKRIEPVFERLVGPMFQQMQLPHIFVLPDLLRALASAQAAVIKCVSRDGARMLLLMYETAVGKMRESMSPGFRARIVENQTVVVQNVMVNLFYISACLAQRIASFRLRHDTEEWNAFVRLSQQVQEMSFFVVGNPRTFDIAERDALMLVHALLVCIPDIFTHTFDRLVACVSTELNNPSQDIVKVAVDIAGDMFTLFPEGAAPLTEQVMSMIFERLNDTSLMWQYAGPMLSTIGDIIAVLPMESGIRYRDAAVNTSRAFMRMEVTDVGIRAEIMTAMLNVGRGLVVACGTDRESGSRCIRNARVVLFWPLMQVSKWESVDAALANACIVFVRTVLDSEIARSALGGELKKVDVMKALSVAAQNDNSRKQRVSSIKKYILGKL